MKTSLLHRAGLALTIAATALAANAAVPVAGPIGTPAAEAACKNATIGGKRKCIGRGQFCAIRHQADYPPQRIPLRVGRQGPQPAALIPTRR